MDEREPVVVLRAHAALTRTLAERARREGNDALARELDRQANDLERATARAA